MIVGLEAVLIGSQNAKKLGAFYKNIIGLKSTMEFAMGENNEYGIAFDLGNGVSMYVMDHSKVKGKVFCLIES